MKLTVPQAATRCGRNAETVRRWIREGKLRSEKVGTQHLIDEDELAAFADGDEQLPLPPAWQKTFDGKPQLNWVRLVRRSRAEH